MKKILVTGGAGYIGTHTVTEILKNSDYEIVIVDNFSNSNPKIFERISKIVDKSFKVYHKDCRENLDDILTQHQIDGIIHFAASKSVGDSVKYPIEYYDNNINSLINIINSAKKFNITNLVFSSSCSLYGNLKELPASEESELSDPQSPYAYTKLVCERILKDLTISNPEFNIVSLRYFNPVGADESGLIGELPINKPNNLVPIICNSAETGQEMFIHGNNYPTRDGTCIRDYIHVSDIANAHLLSMNYLFDKNNSDNFEIFNLGFGDKGVSVLELINSFEKVNNIKVNFKVGPRRDGDVVEIYSDSSKAKNILGWSPQRGIDTIVKSAWNWHKNKI